MFESVLDFLSIHYAIDGNRIILNYTENGYEAIADFKHFRNGNIEGVFTNSDKGIKKECFFFDSVLNAICFFRTHPFLLNVHALVVVTGDKLNRSFFIKIQKTYKTILKYYFCSSNTLTGKILTIQSILFLSGIEEVFISKDKEDNLYIMYDDRMIELRISNITNPRIKSFNHSKIHLEIKTPPKNMNEFKNIFKYK